MTMDKSTSFYDLPLATFNSMSVKLAVLEEQLTQHAELESHYPEVAKVFDGLRKYVIAIRESIPSEEVRTEPNSDNRD